MNPWFNACFKFFMWTTYSLLSCKLVTSFSTFSIFILFGKNGKSLWSSSYFLGYWTSASRKCPPWPFSMSFITFFNTIFYEISIKYLGSIKIYLLEAFTSACLHLLHLQLSTSQYLRYDDSLFLSYSFVYLLLTFAYRWTFAPLFLL